MKRILIAVAALGLMAGGAVAMDDDGMMAEGPAIEVGGSGKLGLVYSGQTKDGETITREPRTSFHSEVDIEFTGQGVTDGGLTFGATATAEFRSGGSGAPTPDVFIGGDMWKIIIGSPDRASDLAFSLGDIGFTGLGVDDIAEEPFKSKDSAQARFELTLGVATVAVTVGQTNGKEVSKGKKQTGMLTDGGLDLSAGETITFAAEDGEYSIGDGDKKFTRTAASVSAFLTDYLTSKDAEGEYYKGGSGIIDALETGMFGNNGGPIAAGQARARDTTSTKGDSTETADVMGWRGLGEATVSYVRFFEIPAAGQATGTTKQTGHVDLTELERQRDGTWERSGTALDPDSASDKVVIDLANEYISYFSLGKDNKIGSPVDDADNADKLTSDGRAKWTADAKEAQLIAAAGDFDKTSKDNVITPAKEEETRTIAEGSEAIADQQGTVTWVEGAVAKATKSKTHWTAGVKADLGPVTFGLGVDSNDSILANVGGDMGQFGGSIFYGRQDGGSTMADLTALGAEVKVTAAEGTTVNAVYAQAERGTAKSDGFGLGVTHALGGGANVEAGFAQVNDQDKFSVGIAMKF